MAVSGYSIQHIKNEFGAHANDLASWRNLLLGRTSGIVYISEFYGLSNSVSASIPYEIQQGSTPYAGGGGEASVPYLGSHYALVYHPWYYYDGERELSSTGIIYISVDQTAWNRFQYCNYNGSIFYKGSFGGPVTNIAGHACYELQNIGPVGGVVPAGNLYLYYLRL